MALWGLNATVLQTKAKYWESQFRGYVNSRAIKINSQNQILVMSEIICLDETLQSVHLEKFIPKCTRCEQVTSFIKQHLLMLKTDFLTKL